MREYDPERELSEYIRGMEGFFSKIDYALLREQKQHLLDVIAYCDLHKMKSKVEALDAILHIIDALQDCAADVLNYEDVFASEEES